MRTIDHGWPSIGTLPPLTDADVAALDEAEAQIQQWDDRYVLRFGMLAQTTVQASSLIPTQAFLCEATMAALPPLAQLPPILVARKREHVNNRFVASIDRLYIVDGHHRATKALHLNEAVRAVIVDLQ